MYMKNLIDELGRTESLPEKTKIIGEIKTVLTDMPGGKRSHKRKSRKHPRSKHPRSKHPRSKHQRSKHKKTKKN
jgi:hypothetical protein